MNDFYSTQNTPQNHNTLFCTDWKSCRFKIKATIKISSSPTSLVFMLSQYQAVASHS